MKYLRGDLLEGDWDVAIQVCNSYKCFGSGIAFYIKNKFPEVYEADLRNPYKEGEILGRFSKASISDEQVFYNLYAMWGLGNDGTPGGRNLTYDHFYDGVIGIVEDARSSTDLDTIVIGLPYLAGCVRAGGSWGIVDAMLQDIENKYQFVEFHVYELENAETIAHSTIPKEIDLVQEDEEMEVPIPREMAIYRWLKGFRLASK
jgi:hypothetical protein|tara:strand:- start:14474 stop:15082 length:609 start_codon:yes stop_codon:yes gene_type:complete